MKCVEFKRLALSDPNSAEASFILHQERCADCLEYVAEIKEMDAGLRNSLDVEIPRSLLAKLELQSELQKSVAAAGGFWRRIDNRGAYAMAASVFVAVMLASILLVKQFELETEVHQDHETLLAGVLEHMNHQPVVPVWSEARANRVTKVVMAAYDSRVQLKHMSKLKFGRICPMGEYKGLHATIETTDGLITFAYIKGASIGDMIDSSYAGYMTKVKPLQGGNLVIFSKTQRAMDEAEYELDSALVWDI